MPFDGTDDRQTLTRSVLNGLMTRYRLPHSDPRTPLVCPDIRSDIRSIRAQLGIRGDDARHCIVKAASGHAWAVHSLRGVELLVRTHGTLESVLLRALDAADGVPLRAAVTPAPRSRIDPTGRNSAAMIARVQKYFGPDGRKWVQRVGSTADGRRCLLGALGRIRGEIRSGDDRVPEYLHRAIAQNEPRLRDFLPFVHHSRGPLRSEDIVVAFNDQAKSFTEVAAVLRRAKELADADARETTLARADARPG